MNKVDLPMNVAAGPETNDAEIDLLMLVKRLWLGKLYVLAATFVAGVIGLTIAVGTPPTFRADALLQLEEKSGQLALPEGLAGLTREDPRSATEIEILRSRNVMSKAVASEHLDWVASPARAPVYLNAALRLNLPLPFFGAATKYARDGERIELDYLEVPTDWLSSPMELRLTENNAFDITLPNGRTVSGTVGEMVRDEEAGFAIRIGAVSSQPGREFSVVQLSEDRAIDRLRGRFGVRERGRGTNILELSMVSSDRLDAQKELRAISNAYLDQNIARSAAEAQSSLSFLQEQLPNAEAEVRRAESALNDFRSSQNAIDLSFEAQSVLTQITNIEGNLRQLQIEEDALADRYTPNHPTYQQLLNEKARLETRLAELKSEVSELPATQRQVVNLTSDLELAQQVYVQLLNRAQELEVLKASTIGNVRIIDQARTARAAVAPSRSRILAMALLLGAIAGIGFVLLKAMLNRGIEDPQVIESAGLPVFATINFSPMAENHRKKKGQLPILVMEDDHGVAAEGFKSLRTSLHFGMLDANVKSIAITGPSPEVGKSFIASNLAVVAAQGGQKVILVDADMRMGYLRRYFNVPKVHLGLSDVLSDKAALEDVVIQTDVPDLYFLPPGQFPPNPSELLMRDTFKSMLAAFDDAFDLTLLDTPPVLAVTDPLIISRSAGSTLLVSRFGETQLGEIEAVQQQYLTAGIKLSGAILNGFDPKRLTGGKYGGSYQYGYRYAYRQSDT